MAGTDYVLRVADNFVAWRSHQRDATLESFDALFALLSERLDERCPVIITSTAFEESL